MSCLPEWNLLKWIRRELKILQRDEFNLEELNTIINGIVVTMNDTFSNWPEDPS